MLIGKAADSTGKKGLPATVLVVVMTISIVVANAGVPLARAGSGIDSLSPVDLLIRLAEFYINSGELDKAARQLNDALKRDPGNHQAERLMLRIRSLQREAEADGDDGGPTAPRTELRLIGGSGPARPGRDTSRTPVQLSFQDRMRLDAALERGLAMASSDNPERALREFETVLSIDPNHMEAVYQIGLIHYNQGNLEEAAELFSRVTKAPDAEAGGFFWLANTYFSLRELEKAEKAIIKAVELNPDDAYIHSLKGRILFEAQDYSRAEGAFLKSLNIVGTVAESLRGLGATYLEKKAYGRAEEVLREYVRRYQDAGDGYVLLARLYLEQSMDERGVEMLQMAESLIPDDPRVLFLKGEVSRSRGSLMEALDFYGQALQVDPYIADAYFAVVDINAQVGRFSDALSMLEQAEGKIGRHLEIRLEKARIYERQNMMQKAMEEYEIAANIAPENTNVLMKLAEAYTVNNWFLDAIDQYEKVLELSPEHSRADWLKGEIVRLRSQSSTQTQVRPDTSGPPSGSSGAGGSPADFF